LIKGRTFTDEDGAEKPLVGVINQALAKHRWADSDPIGHRVSVDNGKTWITIVGIVGDTKEITLSQPTDDEFYLPMDQLPSVGGLIVRTMGDPKNASREIRQMVYEADPDTAITHELSLEEARSLTLASPRLTTNLLGIFAGLALVMAATGIGGMMALAVSQRIHEIGIRMALGARPVDVLGMVLWQGLALGAAGIALGVLAAMVLTQLLRSLLFEISPSDPITFVGVAGVLLAAAGIACWLPARRAARIDPLVALRFE
jgi:putative ABC transport system permease protein